MENLSAIKVQHLLTALVMSFHVGACPSLRIAQKGISENSQGNCKTSWGLGHFGAGTYRCSDISVSVLRCPCTDISGHGHFGAEIIKQQNYWAFAC